MIFRRLTARYRRDLEAAQRAVNRVPFQWPMYTFHQLLAAWEIGFVMREYAEQMARALWRVERSALPRMTIEQEAEQIARRREFCYDHAYAFFTYRLTAWKELRQLLEGNPRSLAESDMAYINMLGNHTVQKGATE